jgi:Leucine-rich repeat (LRR) protein
MARFSLLIALAATLSLRPPVLLSAEKLSTSSAALASAIDDLSSPRFSTRESATRRIRESGLEAIPLLKAAVAAGGLETVSRGMSILHHFHLEGDDQLSRSAFQAIRRNRELSPDEHSPQTAHTIRHLWLKWERKAKTLLKQRGAKNSQSNWIKITIDEDWNGDDRDLRLLHYVSNLGTLNASESSISDIGLEKLCHLPDLHTLRVNVRGSGLVHLRHLPSLTFLSLKTSQLDEGVLAGLAGCERLQSLGLDDTNVTDADLEKLPVLPELRDVWLNRSLVCDDGLAHVARLPKLRKLILTGINLEGPGLAHLAKIPSLEYISLKHTRCNASCMPLIGQLTQVTSLGLDDTPVTDAGMEHIESLAANLDTLWLTNAKISDRSAKHLKKLVNLNRLYLSGTNLTRKSVSDLRLAMPHCKITFEQPKSE